MLLLVLLLCVRWLRGAALSLVKWGVECGFDHGAAAARPADGAWLVVTDAANVAGLPIIWQWNN